MNMWWKISTILEQRGTNENNEWSKFSLSEIFFFNSYFKCFEAHSPIVTFCWLQGFGHNSSEMTYHELKSHVFLHTPPVLLFRIYLKKEDLLFTCLLLMFIYLKKPKTRSCLLAPTHDRGVQG